MTEAPTEATGPQASYELNYELDGTSVAVRENLADILQRELLGPIHGPEETLPFSPRSQYLVGHIAPVKLVGSTTAGLSDSDGGDLVEVSGEPPRLPLILWPQSESDRLSVLADQLRMGMP